MLNAQKIDSLLGIEVDRITFKDQLRMLFHYRVGMESIFQTFKHQESKMQNEGAGVIVFYSAEISEDFYRLLPSYFQWFSISACNYARLVAFLEGVSKGKFPLNRLNYNDREKNLVKDYCNSYMNSITELKNVKQWRNKVAAHPALIDPSSMSENSLTRQASTFISHAIEEGRFLSKTFVSREMRNGKLVTDDLKSWSITKVFEDLAPRFWPNTSE